MGPPPVVTGVSPKEAAAGTKITIRGENLGVSPQDLVDVNILGIDCLLTAEWVSSTKITALCPANSRESKGKIIVVTTSGGVGSCNVQFRYYKETVSPLKDVAYWVPEKFFIQKRTRAYAPIASSSEFDDALGLSVESKSDFKADTAVQDLFQERFENKSADLRSPNFDPALFLLTHHSRTTFEDLKAGTAYLRRKVEGENENQLSFIKSNVGCIVEQLDTLKSLKKCQEAEDKRLSQKAIISSVERSMHQAKTEADKMFCDVLGRKDRADATRNAINVINRFKFVFFLPSNLEQNLAKGDYDRIIDEYERAVTLYGNTDSEIIRKYLAEIERGVASLKTRLNKAIHQEDLTMEQQKKLIANLVQIDSESDPAWNCLQLRYNSLLSLMEECDGGRGSSHSGNGPVQQAQQQQQQQQQQQVAQLQQSDMEWAKGLVGVEVLPARIAAAERLTMHLADNLPDLWRLGQAYFKGELAVTPGSGRQIVFKEMILGSIRYYTTLIRESTSSSELSSAVPEAVDPARPKSERFDDEEYALGESPCWHIYCLRFVRHLHEVLIDLDLPSEALDLIVGLLSDLRLHCIQIIFQTMVDKVNQLHFVEDWHQEVTDEHGAVTKLPDMFLSVVLNSVHFVKEVLSPANDKEDVILSSDRSVEDFRLLIQNVMASFAFTLENTAIEEHSSSSPSTSPSESAKLVICINNCRYTLDEVLPKIRSSFQTLFKMSVEVSFQGASSSYEILIQKLVEAYIELKRDPIVAVIEPNMYVGKFDWARCPKPKDARDYVKGIVHNVVAVFGELKKMLRSSPGTVDEVLVRIMESVVEVVAEEINRLFCCISRMNSNGCIQAWVDINCLKLALRPYLTQVAEDHLNEACKPLLDLERPGDRGVVEACENTFRHSMSIHLSALSRGEEQG